ncbi:radical SAM protein [Desulfovirgula thermocuniculi]|uniref:radical SAM protein n=1 Tax=Desulfovirgula thermocuniculi TaxID=348842 RepID=UPI00042A4144|nr:radical SAM protein [Desulfovirgula thermocuniculi]
MQAYAMEEHPCFFREAARHYGRLHLPVAPACNITCRYCRREYDCPHEGRPGATSRVLTPEEAVARVAEVLKKDARICVVGIAGPGDPLANEETFATLRLVHARFPHLIKCLSTNGLLLADCVPQLKALGVRAVTVTVNAVNPAVGAAIYAAVRWRGAVYEGMEGAALLWSQQAAGIAAALRAGLRVKVNAVFIPGINDRHLPAVARAVAALGVQVMNIMPLIPLADFAHLAPPGPGEVSFVRRLCRHFLPQIDWCRQCRADAVGLI